MEGNACSSALFWANFEEGHEMDSIENNDFSISGGYNEIDWVIISQ